MKKVLLSLTFASLLLSACSKPDSADQNTEAQSTAQQTAQQSTPSGTNHPDPAHSAENSLDWNGTYEGTLPCADCNGIRTELTLNSNKTYRIAETYLGRGKGEGASYVTNGTFNFDNRNTSIIVLDKKADARQYFIAENKVYALDSFGEKITGDFESMYILSKTVK
ncbi:Uncharacterized lipoprotein NlpE involved in copper resistance [Acinetobacter marinus]|uniref:Uncharacterized lipoprotein NlpE involved in copper resistance n=1 Tax=Acinetobacter marinus TaxID=281375 RepID=A0A1G6JRN7_9GAMM|nr:copper resistance protein NlpE [Acinetobacter marinus]SDC20656.1 Uncharacterized lipoprotein NlpE involved in copper resistance [Acinetobacter marinus]